MLCETQRVKTRDLHRKKLQENIILDRRTPIHTIKSANISLQQNYSIYHKGCIQAGTTPMSSKVTSPTKKKTDQPPLLWFFSQNPTLQNEISKKII